MGGPGQLVPDVLLLPVLSQVPEIHCENCGRSIEARASETRFCLECGLYVCPACWDQSRELCRNCGTRPRVGIRIRTARRADRRLREVAKQATLLALGGTATDEPEAWIEHACLAIKSETANRVGFRAWSRLRGERAERARPLVERIRRHSHEADAAIERAGVALLRRGLDRGDEDRELATPGAAPRDGATRQIIRRRGSAAGGALLVAAAVAVVMVGGQLWLSALDHVPSAREGTLAGNAPGPSSVATPVPGLGEATPTATPTETILSVDFNRERMGQGLGADWVQTAGGANTVVLAPIPTAVNRSARLETESAGGAAEACRPVAEPGVRVTGLGVDIVLAQPETTAMLIGRNASGSPVMLLSFGTSGSAVTASSGDVLARGDGLAVGDWVRTGITALGEQTRWLADGEQAGTLVDDTIDGSALAEVEQICLAVRAPSAGAAHFDNLTIATVKEG